MSEASRPWYVSLTAKWCEAENFCDLKKAIDRLLVDHPLPYHHLRVPEHCWHSTLYAVLIVKHKDPGDDSLSDTARKLFDRLKTATEFVDRARGNLPLLLQPSKLQCFDDGTTVQFGDDHCIAQMRTALRPLIVDRVHQAITFPLQATAYHLLDDHKSNGASVFGSIARSGSPSDGDNLRWWRPLPSIQPLRFRSIHFLVSDDALTNYHDTTNSLRISVP